MVDKKGVVFGQGARIKWYPHNNSDRRNTRGGKPRKGTVLSHSPVGIFVDVVLDGDPFGTFLDLSRIRFVGAYDEVNPLITRQRHTTTSAGIDPTTHRRSSENMAKTGTGPSPKELRRQAKALRISGWEDMDRAELKRAIKKAGATPGEATKSKSDKATSKKAPKGKKAAKPSKSKSDDDEDDGPNPFRAGTNLFHITEELMKGGKRSSMVKRLSKKIELKPRKNKKDFDETAELDRRVLIVGQILRNEHGFEVTREGRGTDATIVAVPPS